MERLGEFIDDFLRNLEARGYSARTLESYRWTLGRLRRFLDEKGIKTFQEVTRQTLSEYQTRTVVERTRQGPPLTAGTRLRLLGHVRQLFRYLTRHAHLLVNPAETLSLPRTVKSPPLRVLTPLQVKRLLLAPDVTEVLGLRDRAMLEVLYSSGIRVSELIYLELADIDVEAQVVHVHRGKGGKSRSVPLGGPACSWVSRYLAESRARLEVKASPPSLFLSSHGSKLDRANVARIVRTLGERAGIPFKVTPHGLRHAFATHLIQRQASLRHVQEMLGHQKIASTQIYTHLDLSDLKATHGRCHPRGRRNQS